MMSTFNQASATPSPVRAIYPVAAFIWLVGFAGVAAAVLVPAFSDLAEGPAGFVVAVAGRIYQLVRVAVPWIPAGMLLAWAVPHAVLRLIAVFGLLACAVAAITLMRGFDAATLRDILYVLPGVAAGAWLGRATAKAFASGTSGKASIDVGAVVATASSSAPTAIDPPSPAQPPAPTMGRRPASSARSSSQPSQSAARRLIRWGSGIASLGLAIWILADFPLGAAFIAVAMLAYAALLWWRPLAWLIVVPAALPLLDLAPWSGRFFVDEFDVVMLFTLGVLLLRGARAGSAPQGRGAGMLIALFVFAALCSALAGLLPLAPLDANAFASYFSPYNALRVGKGVLWAAAFYFLVRHTGTGEDDIARLFALGMGIGLLGVGLIGFWERWLYVGIGNEASTYRIVSTFSSMHTGGGHIEAYLVAAVPFLWLGLFRWRTALVAAAVLVLTAYVMLFTVSRGGVLALGIVAVILGAGTLQLAFGRHRRTALVAIAALAAVTVVLGAGVGGGYLQQRFATSAQDWATRVEHWRLGLGIADDSWSGRVFGTGLGTFPRRYLEKGPAERQPATFAFIDDSAGESGHGMYLRLGVGDTLYVAQRITLSDGGEYRLLLDVRAPVSGGRVAVPICEKQLLNSRRCAWGEFEFPVDGKWHSVSRNVDTMSLGKGAWWQHLPTEIFFHNPGSSGVVDVDNVRLLDSAGRNLVANGDFSAGGDRWFFKTHSHLPWHLKNLWVHVMFEMGALGSLLLGTLVICSYIRLVRMAWKGSRLGWVLLASLSGLLVVGVFDSLADAPRIAMLLFGFLFLGVGLRSGSTMDWAPSRADASRAESRRRNAARTDSPGRPAENGRG